MRSLPVTIALSALLLAAPAFGLTMEQHKRCKKAESTAANVMMARQTGTPRSEIVEGILQEEDLTKARKELLIQLIQSAYDNYRVYSKEAAQERAVQDFADKVYGICVDQYQNRR